MLLPARMRNITVPSRRNVNPVTDHVLHAQVLYIYRDSPGKPAMPCLFVNPLADILTGDPWFCFCLNRKSGICIFSFGTLPAKDCWENLICNENLLVLVVTVTCPIKINHKNWILLLLKKLKR